MLFFVLLLLFFVALVSCHRPFPPESPPEPRAIPKTPAIRFGLQHFPYCLWCSKSSCFCTESVERFLGMASKFSVTILLLCRWLCYYWYNRTFPVLHSLPLSAVHKLLYFRAFSAFPFARHSCPLYRHSCPLYCHIYLYIVHVFYFLFLIITSGVFAITAISVCNP